MFYEESKREERVKKTYSFGLRNKGGTRNFHKRAERGQSPGQGSVFRGNARVF